MTIFLARLQFVISRHKNSFLVQIIETFHDKDACYNINKSIMFIDKNTF